MQRRVVQTAESFDYKRLAFREQWAHDSVLGPLFRLEPLTDHEHAALEQWRASTWVPQHALHYAWHRMSPVHDRGGTYYLGRLRTPSDPGYGDGWRLDRFHAALDRDRAAIAAFVRTYPEHAARLDRWLRHMETYARERTEDAEGPRALTLRELGYDALVRVDDDEE